MKYELHPACAAWPEMPPEALRKLADDIEANGLRDPLTLDPAGLLLDGRNRMLACEIAGVEPQTVVYSGDPALFSLSKNAHRRHMNRDQIAMVAAKLATRGVGNPSFAIGSNEPIGPSPQGPSNAEAAAAAGVPETSIKSAKAVLTDGTVEEIEAVKSGKAKLRATADAIRARNKPAPEPPATPSSPSPPSPARRPGKPKKVVRTFEAPDTEEWNAVVPSTSYDDLGKQFDMLLAAFEATGLGPTRSDEGPGVKLVIFDCDKAGRWFKEASAEYFKDWFRRAKATFAGLPVETSETEIDAWYREKNEADDVQRRANLREAERARDDDQ